MPLFLGGAWRIAPKQPKKMGRPLYPLSVMLRVHCLQLFYNLSDPALKFSIIDQCPFQAAFIRQYSYETHLNFRHFLEKLAATVSEGN